jgi:hypothetical protein
MSESFLTAGLQDDRYLKAIQLIERFETELRRELERIGDEIVSDNPELFVDGVEASWNNSRSSGSIIAFARLDYQMNRPTSTADDDRKLKLNISFRWIEPTQLGHQNVEGALSVASYKIKYANPDRHIEVKESTRSEEWNDISCADDAFNNSPGIFYIPVNTAEEMHEAHDRLKAHFEAHASMYGEPDTTNPSQ